MVSVLLFNRVINYTINMLLIVQNTPDFLFFVLFGCFYLHFVFTFLLQILSCFCFIFVGVLFSYYIHVKFALIVVAVSIFNGLRVSSIYFISRHLYCALTNHKLTESQIGSLSGDSHQTMKSMMLNYFCTFH